jgi:very-short-patch-repair endonuclease
MAFTTVADAARYRVQQIAVGRWKRSDETGFRIAFDRCESPIEQAYCLSLFQVPGVRSVDQPFSPDLLRETPSRRQIMVFAQHGIEQYRADFLLVGLSPHWANPTFVVAECDGEDFHSSREQIRYDQKRQEALMATGFAVVRFRGREIYTMPERTVGITIAAFAAHGWDTADAKYADTPVIREALMEFARLDDPNNATPVELP